MKKDWLISNEVSEVEGLQLCIKNESFSFHASDGDLKRFSEDCYILINGYFVPRNRYSGDYTESQEALIYKMYKEYGLDFPNYGKGCYNIVIIDNDDFLVVSDRFGQIKHFIYEQGEEFILSNSLEYIAMNIDKEIDYLSLAIHTLFCHYIGERTLLKDVQYNDAGGIIFFKESKLMRSRYDIIDRLYEQEKNNITVNQIAEVFSDSVADIIKRLDIKDVSLSLTGGMDTRNLLASLLKQGIRPHVYTYGNPKSEDSLRSQDIANGLDLEHALYDYKPKLDEFMQYAKRIVKEGQTLTSIHRVHRLWSVEKETSFSKNMFLGTLGGEYVKGVHFNDYIISKFIEKYWDSEDRKGLLKAELEKKCFNLDLIDLDELFHFVEGQSFNQSVDRNCNIFHVLSYITARTHDAQDINIYNSEMDYVFTPFLDIDYLEILFSSEYTFDLKNRIKNRVKRRLSNPIYSTQMIYSLYAPLAKYEYAGKYSPREMKLSPYYAMVKKILRTKLRASYPENFPLNQWMIDFVDEVYKSGLGVEMKDVFDYDQLLDQLQNNQHDSIEAYWLKFTNIIHHQYEFEFLKLAKS